MYFVCTGLARHGFSIKTDTKCQQISFLRFYCLLAEVPGVARRIKKSFCLGKIYFLCLCHLRGYLMGFLKKCSANLVQPFGQL